MTAQTKNRRGFWQNLLRRDGRKAPGPEAAVVAEPSQQQIVAPDIEVAPNDLIAAHFGVNAPVTLEKVCVDPKVQWSQIKNLWHNAGARSMLYTMAGPGRWMRGLMRRRGT